MKRIIIIAISLLVAAGAYAQEGKRLYHKYSDSEGVSAVYISPAMFRMIGNLPELDVEVSDGEKMDLAPLVRSFTGFYMLSFSDDDMAEELNKEVKVMIGKGRYEILMEIKDNGKEIHIYTSGNEKVIDSFVFIAEEENSTAFICLEGSMNRSDVENLIAKSVK